MREEGKAVMADNDEDMIDVGGDDQDTDQEQEETTTDPEPYKKADGSVFTADDYAKLKTALTAARKDARAAKAGTPAKDGDKDGADQDAVARARQEEADRFKPMVVRTAAKAALSEAGLIVPKGRESATYARVIRMLDLSDVEVGDDGDVDGLTDQIEDIKADFPDLFRDTKKVVSIDSAGKSTGPGAKKLTTDEILAKQLMGGR